MFNSFTDTCRYLDFPGEAIESLCTQYEKIRLCPTTADYICKVFEEYSSNSLTESLYTHQVNFEKLCQDIDVHSYSSQMIFYICLVPALWDKYLERGLPEEIFRDSMADLRCKLFECYRLYGIWGSFVAVWFSRFFNFTLYGIGRLEFAPYSCDFDFTLTKNGRSYCIKKGDPVIDVHIPSRGRLPHEEVLDSYKRALEFFKNTLKIDATAFVCESWMLFPEHKSIIPEAKNLLDFMNDYSIVHDGKSRDDLWRIFYCFVGEDYDIIPQNTYLQRQYVEFMKNGGEVGWGQGICFSKDIFGE